MGTGARSRPETELYGPVRDYLIAQGYTVRGEVKDCDVAAVKDGDLIVVELKRSLNITLLAQAVDRQKATDSVYVAIPRPANKREWMSRTKDVLYLLRRLELGLILVLPGGGRRAVDIVLHPTKHERGKRAPKRRAILTEIGRRSVDLNEGGCCRRRVMTAYRENALRIAACIADRGPLSPKALRALGTGESTSSILQKNFYSWFERIDRGVYDLTDQGRRFLDEYPDLAAEYTRSLQDSV